MSDRKGGRPDRKEFRRVKEAKAEGEEKPKSAENHVRVVASRGQRMYIKYAIDVFNGTDGKAKNDAVVLTGMGNAVYNVVNVAEILKRRVKGLHQTTDIASETMTDKYEAVEEGKEGLEIERKVSTIKIILSTAQLDKNHPGYQAPLPESEVTEEDLDAQKERRPRKKKADTKKAGEKKGEKKEKDGEKKEVKQGSDKKDDRKKEGKKEGEKKEGGGRRRGGGDKKEDRPARGDEKKDDRAPARGRGGRTGGRGGRDDRDDRAPVRGGRGGSSRRSDRDRTEDRRDDRAPARGRGGYSETRREGGPERGGRRN